MNKLIFAAVVVLLQGISTPLPAGAAPKPAPESTCFENDNPGQLEELTCFYRTQKDCWAGRRARHRQGVSLLSPCYLNGPLYPEFPADHWFYTYVP